MSRRARNRMQRAWQLFMFGTDGPPPVDRSIGMDDESFRAAPSLRRVLVAICFALAVTAAWMFEGHVPVVGQYGNAFGPGKVIVAPLLFAALLSVFGEKRARRARTGGRAAESPAALPTGGLGDRARQG